MTLIQSDFRTDKIWRLCFEFVPQKDFLFLTCFQEWKWVVSCHGTQDDLFYDQWPIIGQSSDILFTFIQQWIELFILTQILYFWGKKTEGEKIVFISLVIFCQHLTNKNLNLFSDPLKTCGHSLMNSQISK